MKTPVRVAIQVPIKCTPSVRLPGKNFRLFAGKPLACHVLETLATCTPAWWDLWLDSDDPDQVKQKIGINDWMGRYQTHQREPWYASDRANGNHLLWQFAERHPEYEILGQAFVTSPFLTGKTVRRCIERLVEGMDHSSVVATKAFGLYWSMGKSLQYTPGQPGSMRSTAECPMVKETTGFYAIRRLSLLEYGTRTTTNPHFEMVKFPENIDIDTEEDFYIAQWVAKTWWTPERELS